MRILHVLGKLDRGGVETWLLQVLRHIDREKYQMDFMVHTIEKGAYDDEVRALGARIIPCLQPSQPLRYARNFCRSLRKHGPYDVVHSHVHHYSGYVLMLAKMCGVPVRIAHSHSDTRAINAAASLRRRMYLNAMQTFVRASANCGLAVSAEAGNELFGKQPQALGWQVQPLGIDLSRFEAYVNKSQIRSSLRIPSDAFVIGHVGRFSYPKNHVFLVEVAREVVSRDQRAVFLLVGEGDLRSAIEEKVRGYGLKKNFIFTGTRSDVPELMKGAMDLLLFPSVYEGLPLTLIEAQAAGLECLISNSISEEVDLIPALMHRANLEQPPLQWALSLLEMVTAPTRNSPESIRKALTSHSISASTSNLMATYATLCSA